MLKKVIVLCRHGERGPLVNLPGIEFVRKEHGELTDAGVEQMRAIGTTVREKFAELLKKDVRAVHSSVSRCQRSLQEIISSLQIDVSVERLDDVNIRSVNEFNEKDEGTRFLDIVNSIPEEHQEMWKRYLEQFMGGRQPQAEKEALASIMGFDTIVVFRGFCGTLPSWIEENFPAMSRLGIHFFRDVCKAMTPTMGEPFLKFFREDLTSTSGISVYNVSDVHLYHILSRLTSEPVGRPKYGYTVEVLVTEDDKVTVRCQEGLEGVPLEINLDSVKMMVDKLQP